MTKKDKRQPGLPFGGPAEPPPPAAQPPGAPGGGKDEDIAGRDSARPKPTGPLPGLASRLRAHLPELFIALAALVVLGIGIGATPLLDPDEARYSAASRTMLEGGEWVVPFFNGHERLNKPPLFYWLQAGSFRLLGTTEAAARIPSVAAALLVLLAVYLFARRECGRETALRAGAILLACPLFAVLGKTASTDMTLCLFIVLALAFWYRLHQGRGAPWTQFAGASVSLGLAFLVKGPVGVALPCAVIAVFLAARREWAGFRPKGILLGGAIAAAVVAPWAALLVARLGGGSPRAGLARIAEILRRETLDRALTGLDHPEPFLFFLAAGLLVFFPWSLFFPPGLARVLTGPERREPVAIFAAVWTLVVLVFFTLIRGKLVTYILPAAPPLALFLGHAWTRSRSRASSTLWLAAGAALVAIAVSGFAGYALAAKPEWLSGHEPLMLGLSAALLLAALLPLIARRLDLATWTLAGAMLLAIAATPLLAGRELGERRSLKGLALEAGIAVRPWGRVVAYKMFRPSLVYYGRREITPVQRPRDLRLALDSDSLVILEERTFDRLPPAWRNAFRLVATQGTVLAVAPIGPLPPRGREGRPQGGAIVPPADE